MDFSKKTKNEINTALNEATVLSVKFIKEKEIVEVVFSPIAVNEQGKVPNDNRLKFVFRSVSRFSASYRLGSWNDKKARILKFKPEEIFERVEEFGHQPIYGGEFIDYDGGWSDDWENRLSCDYRATIHPKSYHMIRLFQESNNKYIEIRIWFEKFEIYDTNNKLYPLQEFINNGKRGWENIYNNEGVSNEFGIYPIKKPIGFLNKVWSWLRTL